MAKRRDGDNSPACASALKRCPACLHKPHSRLTGSGNSRRGHVPHARTGAGRLGSGQPYHSCLRLGLGVLEERGCLNHRAGEDTSWKAPWCPHSRQTWWWGTLLLLLEVLLVLATRWGWVMLKESCVLPSATMACPTVPCYEDQVPSLTQGSLDTLGKAADTADISTYHI